MIHFEFRRFCRPRGARTTRDREQPTTANTTPITQSARPSTRASTDNASTRTRPTASRRCTWHMPRKFQRTTHLGSPMRACVTTRRQQSTRSNPERPPQQTPQAIADALTTPLSSLSLHGTAPESTRYLPFDQISTRLPFPTHAIQTHAAARRARSTLPQVLWTLRGARSHHSRKQAHGDPSDRFNRRCRPG